MYPVDRFESERCDQKAVENPLISVKEEQEQNGQYRRWSQPRKQEAKGDDGLKLIRKLADMVSNQHPKRQNDHDNGKGVEGGVLDRLGVQRVGQYMFVVVNARVVSASEDFVGPQTEVNTPDQRDQPEEKEADDKWSEQQYP